MKIVFIAPFGLAQKTTIWARTLPLAKELVKLGHEVSILIPPWDTPSDSGKRWVDDGVTLINVSLRGGILAIIFRLLTEIRSLQPAIIHIVKPRAHAGIVQWILWQLRRWKISQFAIRNSQFTIHLDLDDWEQAWNEINHYPWLVAKFLAWQEEWGIRHADGITVASRWLETRVKEYAPGVPVLYLPNGVGKVDKETRRWGDGEMGYDHSPFAIRNSQFAILYLTRYVEVAPEWLAEFWASLHTALPAAQLIIAGEPLQVGRDRLFRAALEEKAVISNQLLVKSEQTIPHSAFRTPHFPISFLGKVTPQQIDELYAGVDCAIFPSATSVLQQAKCSVRLATTLLHGVPVIASVVGEQANYGANGAARLVAADASAQEFALAVIEVLQDQLAQKKMIERAKQWLSKRYEWTLLAEQLNEWYQNQITVKVTTTTTV